MPRRIRSLCCTVAGVCLGLATVAAAAADPPPASAAFRKAMHAGMAQMMRDMHSAEMTGDPDHDFLAMMIPHHAGAVEMARLQLIYGRDPLVRRLAEEIIASQQSEIAAMRARLKVIQERKQGDPGEYPSPHGLRGEAERNGSR